MKKYALFFTLFIFLFFGCKSRKHVARTVENQTRVERLETTIDTSRVIETSYVDSRESTTEKDNSYIRTTDYDFAGVVRRVQEEWRDLGRDQLVVRDNGQRTVHLSGSSSTVAEKDSSTVATFENEKVEVDSRPVQGAEWLWLAIGAGAIVVVLLLIYIPRRKIKNL